MVLAVGRLEIDESRLHVRLRGRDIPLRPLAARVLAELARNPDRTLTRQSLAESLWGPDAPVTSRSIDTCVARIRRALDGAGDAIVTVRRVGYRLDAERLM